MLVPLRDRLDTGSLALVLLLPPLVASNGGRTLSLVLALISALTFNFLFTQPYYSFRIESSASIAAFVIYVLIALVLANYVGGFRTASAAAHAASAQHGAAADARDRPHPQRRPAAGAPPHARRI